MNQNTLKHKILIIEDDSVFCKECCQVFSSQEFEVQASTTSMGGIVKAVEFRPDVILLDIVMPEVDGYEIIDALRNNSNMNVIIIAYSNITENLQIHRALQLGADDFFSKSTCPPSQAVQKVQHILSQKA